MARKNRKIEAHRITISGLPDGTEYGQYLKDVRDSYEDLESVVVESGGKSHALCDVGIRNDRFFLRFISFTTGFRPDILDTEDYELETTPLSPTQTGVEWTHVVGTRKRNRILIVVEKLQAGIYPATIAGYLQALIDDLQDQDSEDDDENPIVVNVEPDPGDAFVNRINQLQRVTKATYRHVRPNPGWADLQTELADQSSESDASKADISMTARRGQSLRKQRGIISAIKRMYRDKELDYASVEGKMPNGMTDEFNTNKLVRSKRVSLQLDENGQVVHTDAWARMIDYLDSIE